MHGGQQHVVIQGNQQVVWCPRCDWQPIKWAQPCCTLLVLTGVAVLPRQLVAPYEHLMLFILFS